MRFSILFCTYERPQLLREALAAVARLRGIDAIDVEVVVVDNADTGSARRTVEEMARLLPFPVRYVEAHPANISVARNKAVAEATGDVIAFLDDDIQVEEGWLEGVRAAVERRDFDIYCGPIDARFAEPDKANPHAVAMFTRHLDKPTGTPLRASGPNRTRGFAIATGNSIFRRGAFSDPVPFDLALGDAGGEDYDLYYRLEQRGLRIGYAAEAKASEFVPAHRCDMDYLVRRHYAGAQVFAFCVVKNSRWPRLMDLVIRLKALGQFAGHLFAAGRMDDDTRRIRRASILGKLHWRQLVPLYRLEAAQLRPKAADESTACGDGTPSLT